MFVDYKTILIFALVVCLISSITTTFSASYTATTEKKFNPLEFIIPLISFACIVGLVMMYMMQQ